MVPQLIARVDGLPVSLLDREVVWPESSVAPRDARELTARQRARIERQTACVHECRLPRLGAGADRRTGCRAGAVGDPLGARAGGAAVMRGHNPVGWAATLLIAVAYAHVLLELAAAVLGVAVAVRLLVAPDARADRRAALPAARPAMGAGAGDRAAGGEGAGRRAPAAGELAALRDVLGRAGRRPGLARPSPPGARTTTSHERRRASAAGPAGQRRP